jgi:hypothetical protein
MLTNAGLVNHAKMALSEKWGYVWGTFGQVLTQGLFQEKLTQYPDGVGKYADFIKANWLNKRSTDCVGLIKGYTWWNGKDPVYTPSTDVSANGMFQAATEKGTINSFPVKDAPIGLCLWKDGHIGVYIGNDQVIEARGTKYGVIQSPLKGEGASPWTHWLKCPFIKYEDVPVKKTYIQIIQENSNGSSDEWVKGIDAAVAAAKADGNLGALEIFRYLPELIEKIGNK